MSVLLTLRIAFIPKQIITQQTEQLDICMDIAAATHSKASAKDCGLNAPIWSARLKFTQAATLACNPLPQDGVCRGKLYIHTYMYDFHAYIHGKKSFNFL